MSDVKAVEFVAEVRQIRGMVDGSVNVTLNFGEDMIEQAKILLGWHHLQVRGVLGLEKKNDGEPERRGKIHI